MSLLTILVADIQETQRQLIDMLLSAEEFHIIGVESGRETLQFLRTKTPDLAILDLELPDIDGGSICEKMRKIARLNQVPVVLTAPPSKELGLDDKTKELARLVKADLLLQKPLGDKNLRERVLQLIRDRAETPSPPSEELKNTQVIDDTLDNLEGAHSSREDSEATASEPYLAETETSELNNLQETLEPLQTLEKLQERLEQQTDEHRKLQERHRRLREAMQRSKEKTELLIHTNVELGHEVERWQKEVEVLREQNRQLVEPSRPSKDEGKSQGSPEPVATSEHYREENRLLRQELQRLRQENDTLRHDLTEIRMFFEDPSLDEASEPCPSLAEHVARQGKELGNLRKRNQLLLQALERGSVEKTGRGSV
jgi:DNA-binding response OmpR family regulator